MRKKSNWTLVLKGGCIYNFITMKRTIGLMILGLLLLAAGACSSVKPFKPAYYRKNIVVKADETIWTNEKQVAFDSLRGDLVAQMIFEETPIMIHFHESLTRETFDKVMGKLKEGGFKNYHCCIYRD
jgi:hypothetical protein